MKAYTIFEVVKILSENNLKMLNKSEYKNSKSKISVIDAEGYKYVISLSEYLIYNKNIKPFATFNPYTIDNIKQYLINNNYKNKLLSTKYENSDSKLIFTCESCECEFEVSFKHFRNAKQTKCKTCAKEANVKKRKLDIEYIRKFFSENGLTLLSDNYVSNNTRLEVTNNEGYKGLISYSSIKVSDGFKLFETTNPFTIFNIHKYIENNNINCKLLSLEYKGKDSNLEFECECGNVFKTRLGTFMTSNKHRCDSCTKKQSRLSYLTEKYLKENKIEYFREYRFSDCFNKIMLPFDFLIFHNEKNILIECDGEQHFNPVKFNGISTERALNTFEYTKNNDAIKDKYCIKNNLTLIRIPYWEYDNDNYIKILNDKLYTQT